MGANLNQIGTVKEESLASFETTENYNVSEYKPPPGGWTSKPFNYFFSRNFTNIHAQRPIASPYDDTVIIDPAESVFDGSWKINNWSHPFVQFENISEVLPQDDTLPPNIMIKGLPWRIDSLLKDINETYAPSFKNGVIMHQTLNTYDYHRKHAPCSGTVVEAFNIDGQAYREVEVYVDEKDTKRLRSRRRMQRKKTTSSKKHYDRRTRQSGLPIRADARVYIDR